MAQGATSLGLLVSFPFFAFSSKTLFFPIKRAFLVIIQCLPLFLLSLFGLPLFHFLFLCLSLLLFFLPSFLSFFLLSFGSLFLPLSFFFFLLGFCFMKRTTSKYYITELFFIDPFSYFGVPSCFLFENPCLVFFFLRTYVVFLVQHECF